MQAIILAAGMGKRLKDLTGDVTKCMVKVNGVSLIERMLAQLDKQELSRIVIVVGYKEDKLKDYIKSLDIMTPIVYVRNQVFEKTNNIYSLFLAREYMREQDTLLLESDLIFEDCVLQTLVDNQYPSLALVAKYESWMDGTVVTLNSDDTIKDFLDKSHFRFSDIDNYYKTVNIYKFSQSFSAKYYVPFLEAYCAALGTNEYYEQVLKVITILDKPEIKALPLERGNWYEVDDVQDLDIAESIFIDAEQKLKRITRRYGGYWRYPHMMDYCFLINPHFPPQTLMDEIKAKFEDLATQTPSDQYINSLLAAKYYGLKQDQIAVGNGAAEMIKSIVDLLPGRMGLVVPAFEEYFNRKEEDVEIFHAQPPDYRYSEDDLINYFGDKEIQNIVVINPDNPSGNYIKKESVLKLADWCESGRRRLIVDESFVDFASIEDTLLDQSILKRYPKLVVIKGISESFGVSGFRLGILASGDIELMNQVKKDLTIWNINSFGEFFLQIFEKYQKDYRGAISAFQMTRDKLFNGLRMIPNLRPIETFASYVLCELIGGLTATKLAEVLLSEHQILVKDVSAKKGMDGQYIRFSIRTPEENEYLLDALAQCMRT